ncbi:ParA family protein [Wenzhouxiangella marina]|uniref:Chromosome partitioning protein n=1 Tax=Wenzhouxiangella marina TaxID=1579979 RepID=A0A0K0XSB8_9GAMM|nr:AAA family ATPase [Wenzhouxiangella marina]AKS40521.1 chromosome partitioning protein [Wenzhouxiangella marina]MBB6088156.1 chromosome partitioning protein [Wenzhouxiangella marina]
MSERNTRIIAVANQKGGVGKTTTSLNLAAGLAELKKRVLLIDMDPQGNASTGSGLELGEDQATICEVLLGEAEAADTVVRVEEMGYDLLPANGDLTAAEVGLMEAEDRATVLKQALLPLAGRYHYIIIDCPPALNVLTLNALTAADAVLIPMQCEYYALEGLTALLNTIEQIQNSVNPALEIEGLVRTMYDIRNNLSGAVSKQLHEHFGDKLYGTVVPRNVRVAEAPSFGQSVIHYDRESRGAVAYMGLAGEFLRRSGERV